MTAGYTLIQAVVFFSLTQGTFLVGQPAQGTGKQGSSSSAGQAASSPTAVTQQAIRVTAGQKAAILAQVSVDTDEGRTILQFSHRPGFRLTISHGHFHRWWVHKVHR